MDNNLYFVCRDGVFVGDILQVSDPGNELDLIGLVQYPVYVRIERCVPIVYIYIYIYIYMCVCVCVLQLICIIR